MVSENLEFIVRVICIGAGDTVVMDLWALLLKQFGVPSLNFALVGRWRGHLPEGQWVHASIATAAPVRGALLIGWCPHYAIGITFASVLLAAFGLS